jgi:hypothetical protein
LYNVIIECLWMAGNNLNFSILKLEQKKVRVTFKPTALKVQAEPGNFRGRLFYMTRETLALLSSLS